MPARLLICGRGVVLEPGQLDQADAGPADPLDAVFRAHYVRLVRLAIQFVDDQDSAEDVVQDVFGRMQRSRQDLHGLADPGRYLTSAVVNQARSSLRRRRVLRAHVFDHPQHIEHRAELQVDGADAAVLQDATAAAIWRAVTRLPSRQRQVVVLRYYESWSIPEIADALGISRGATSSSLNRALTSLTTSIGSINADD